ncbi:alpha/beta hydrolase-fold protein [Corynebacterium sp. ES2715-CONJ3]|uniref:alpha/beta hydrolase-fold protein n=1 Tax=Corynebacterium sp. ES2715-CONJ3 TaxID=2974028 RepID=UPI0021696784|nr:alpha/beta hydrolase-fold protein [Corynebacterium sp. ES2715-CONJ3]MCS4492058.1 alpha/beta hydrolase-fold protein [Corynebacterium sp. ES2715-CONJ3]
MRDTASRSTRRTRWVSTLPVVIGLGLVGVIPATTMAQSSGSSNFFPGLTDYLDPNSQERTPIRVDENPNIQGLPAGVEVERVNWISDRRIQLYIRSAVMPGAPVKVQILLARDWHSNPTRTFPEVWALDGLRATDIENGWTSETNIEQLFADKNVNVILPIGGESSFYSDWQRENNGKHYMWESFLTQELVPILRNGYRSNEERAIFGLSMGGTAAINLAERHPQLFKFVGSFSGYLDMTSVGMPAAVKAALQDGGGYDAEAMWGPEGSQDWIDHDPKLGIESLKGKTVYVSAGSGRDDFGEPDSVAKHGANSAGIGLEVISRMTTQTFVDYAKRAQVEVISVFRPTGVHAWPYWQYELGQAWPHMAKALNISKEDRGADCTAIGAIAEATRSGIIGNCVNNEYDVPGGKAEDFTRGRAYWSPEHGAFALYGRIGALYTEMGGPASWLGFPLSTERELVRGGRYVAFEHGNIYWTPALGAVAVPKDIVDKWGELQWENGTLGYPVSAAEKIGDGFVQQFEGGYVVRTPDNKNFHVRGAIAAKYRAINTATSNLGFPTTDEIAINGGAFQRFERGNIYWSPATDAHVINYGDIFDAWAKKNWEQGEFGFPTQDHALIPAGGEIVHFERGTISQINGLIVEEKK